MSNAVTSGVRRTWSSFTPALKAAAALDLAAAAVIGGCTLAGWLSWPAGAGAAFFIAGMGFWLLAVVPLFPLAPQDRFYRDALDLDARDPGRIIRGVLFFAGAGLVPVVVGALLWSVG